MADLRNLLCGQLNRLQQVERPLNKNLEHKGKKAIGEMRELPFRTKCCKRVSSGVNEMGNRRSKEARAARKTLERYFLWGTFRYTLMLGRG